MIKRAAALTAWLAAVPAVAQIPPPDAAFDGVARTGSDTRNIRFRFFCSANDGPNLTGVLSVELEVPRYEQMRAVFNFDPFEGPDAHAGPQSELQASGARGRSNARFTAAGSATEGTGGLAFVLEVTASRRESGPLRKLATSLRPLLDGPARLVWRQGSATKGGAPMTATLELTAPQSETLRKAVGSCMNGR